MLQLELEIIRSFWSRPVWDGWLNHNLCHREHRQSWAWPLFGQVWVRWWLAARWLCLPLSLDWTEIMGGGLIDLSTTGYHGAMNYSLLYHYSDSQHHYTDSPAISLPPWSCCKIRSRSRHSSIGMLIAHIWGNVVCYTVILLLSHDITCVHSTYKQHAKVSSLLSNSL